MRNFSEDDLLNFDFEYRDILNIPDNVFFGVEIEFVDAFFDLVRREIDRFNLKDFTCYPDVTKFITSVRDYDEWKCINDSTVQYDDIYGQVMGGEVTSPILFNSNDCFKALHKVCDILNSIDDLSINFRCGLHVHVDRTIYGEDGKSFLRLLKLWMLYEDIIYRFSYGNTSIERAYVNIYAQPINQLVYRDLDILNKYENDDFEYIIKLFRRKILGLSFFHTKKSCQQINNTVEVRMFNGTTDETIIQNDINFVVSLFMYAISDSYDDELIEYMIKKFSPMELKNFRVEKKDKAIEFSNLIFKNDIDKLYFLKQYLKLHNKKKILRR